MKSIIIKIVYNGITEGFWSYKNFSNYMKKFPNKREISVKEKKNSSFILVNLWILEDYEVELTYEKFNNTGKAKIKIEGMEENLTALESKILQDANNSKGAQYA